jgi:hypothetical protein
MLSDKQLEFFPDDEGLSQLSDVGGHLLFQEDHLIPSKKRLSFFLIAIICTVLGISVVLLLAYTTGFTTMGWDVWAEQVTLWSCVVILISLWLYGSVVFVKSESWGPTSVFENGIILLWEGKYRFTPWSLLRYYRIERHWFFGRILRVGPRRFRILFPKSMEGFDSVLAIVSTKLEHR